jgi:hypothetical protein
MQVSIVVLPLMVVAAILWRYREVIERQSAPSVVALIVVIE